MEHGLGGKSRPRASNSQLVKADSRDNMDDENPQAGPAPVVAAVNLDDRTLEAIVNAVADKIKEADRDRNRGEVGRTGT